MSEFPEMGRRYSRLEEIGRGGTGTVYRAHDELLDREVAIKVLHRSAGLDAADEFLFLASHDHPHLVRVFDFGRVDDRGYFTMELLGGRNLAEFVREEIGSPAGDEAEWLEILESLVGSLDYLHSRGVLHLDLKPENILVDRADERITLKLIDFGLSAGLGTERDGGTLEYTAPERLRGEEATPRSDLYSLGAVLYELVTGAPPFQAERREDLITQQIHTPAKPLQSSEPLAGVVRSLLEKDPADRPASADVVRRRLLPERESPSIAPAFSSVLVRRDTVDRIVELSQASRSVMVRGPRGAGKTRLLQEARIRLQILGRRLVAGDAPRAGEAGSALRHLLESLDRTIDSTALERLRALLGSLEKDANGLEGDELRESFAHSFASALIDLGRQESLTWMIDEIERVDSVSLETIRFTLRLSEHSDDAEISLVLASRDDDEVSRARSESLLTPSSRHLTTLRTGNFDPREVHEYLEALLPGADGLADISERLHQETGGHPFTVEEYLRDLAAGSLLIRDGTEWRLRDGAELPVPFRLEEYARRRLDQAPTSERHIVDWISLIGEAISSDELREILVRSGSRELVTLAARGELEARLGRSVLDQILRRDGALYGVPNEALRQASYRGIDERRRRKMHRSVALHLESRSESTRQLDEQLAHHWYHSDEPERSLPHLVRSADRARRSGAPSEASLHLTRALEHESDERKRLSLLLSREEAWGQLGDHPHRDADLEAARELSAKLDDAASEREVALREALALDAAGQKTAALEILDREQERPGFDEASEARLLNRSAMIRLFTGDFDRATPSLERAREIARRLSLPELEAEALQLSGLSFYLRGQYDDALQNMSSALSLRKALDDSFRAASLESNLGLIHLDRGQLRAAAEHFEDSLSLFRRVRHLRGEVVGLVNLGLVQTEFGRYESALHHLGQALRLRRDLGDRHGEASDLGNLGFVWFRLGKYERAVPLLNSAIEVASETENRGTMAINESRLAAIETLRGGFASAADRLATAQDLATNHAQTLVVGTTRARFLLRSERVDEAQSVADNALATARGAKMKTRIVDCLVLSATCQLARGDLEGADASSAEAVSEVESMNSWIAVSQEAYFVRYRTLSALRQRGSAPEPPEDSLRRAYGLLREKADALHDDDIRASFLRDDELNREIDLAHAELQSRTRTEADLRERSFYEIAKSIHAIVELDPLLDRLLEIAIESTRADKGLILLREGDESFTTRAARGMARESVDEATDICRSVIEDVTRGGRPVLATDANSDQRFRDRESIISFQIRTLMCVPLSARDEVLGAVYVDGRGAESFAPNDLDYLVSLAQLAGIAVDNARLLDRLKAENRDLREEVATRFGTGSIVAQSKGMESLLELARKVAHSDVSVLISGETGTGKSLIARTVHYGSPRSSNPFVTVDCGALPENLLESELFGHRRGAFSGAIYDRVGLFEEAEGGTLFLDEISNTSLDLQAKLLRAIQEGEIRRVGDNEVHRVNVRILAASNRDLLALVSRGEFREDLYYRLNVVSLVVPPLRDRPEDIPALAKRFLAGSCERLGRPPITISDEGLRTLYSAPWPGNVRELENTIERAVVLADGSELDAASFSILHDASEASVQSSALSGTSALPGMRARSLEEFDQRWLEAERDYLLDLVENADWNLSAAARAARVRNRNTFISRLKKHGIQRPEE